MTDEQANKIAEDVLNHLSRAMAGLLDVYNDAGGNIKSTEEFSEFLDFCKDFFCQLSDEMVKKLEDLKFVDEIENEILGRMNM